MVSEAVVSAYTTLIVVELLIIQTLGVMTLNFDYKSIVKATMFAAVFIMVTKPFQLGIISRLLA